MNGTETAFAMHLHDKAQQQRLGSAPSCGYNDRYSQTHKHHFEHRNRAADPVSHCTGLFLCDRIGAGDLLAVVHQRITRAGVLESVCEIGSRLGARSKIDAVRIAIGTSDLGGDRVDGA